VEAKTKEEQYKELDERMLKLIKKGKIEEAREIARNEYVPLKWAELEASNAFFVEEIKERAEVNAEKEKRYQEAYAKFKARQEEINKETEVETSQSSFAEFKKVELKDFLRSHRGIGFTGNPNMMSKPSMIKILEKGSLEGKTSLKEISEFLASLKEEKYARVKRIRERADKKYGKAK